MANSSPVKPKVAAADAYPLRVAACLIVLLLHATILGREVSAGTAILILLHTLLYPHLAYLIASRKLRDDRPFILVDNFAYGCCVSLWGFNPFATTVMVCGIMMTSLAAGGQRLLVQGTLVLIGGALLTTLGVGLHFRAELAPAAALVSTLGMLGFSLGLGLTVYRVNRSLGRSRQQIAEQNRQLRDISALAHTANSHLEMDTIMQRVIESLRRLYPLEQVCLVRLDADGTHVTVARTYGDALSAEEKSRLEGFRICLAEHPNSIFVRAATQSQPTYISELRVPPTGRQADVDRLLYDVRPPCSLAFFPLMVDLRTIGCIAFLNYHNKLELRDTDLQLITEYLVQVGTAIRNTQLLEAAAAAKNEALLAQKRAEQSEEAKSRFLANMSHEIRTPMAAILGYAEALSDPGLSAAEKQRFVQTIVRSGHHLLAIINDILDLSKIQSGKLDVEHISVSLPVLLEELRSPLGMRASEQSLAFLIAPRFPLPESFVSDPTRLRQILLNLGSNAIKFTAQGSVTLGVGIDAGFSPPRLTFDVTDSGIGMSPEVLARVFSPFSQADASTTRHYGGTGLGLHISRQLATLLGGDIGVRSSPGHGSTFTLWIPLVTPPGAAMLEKQDDLSQPGREGTPVTPVLPRLSGYVLVAEDNLDNQQLISHLLRQMTVRHRIVTNGEQALQALEQERFDLALLDIQMPGLGGEEVMRQIAAWPDAPPAVAITANVMRHQVARYLQAGFRECLAKPLDREQLLRTLASFLQPLPVMHPPRILIAEDQPVNARLLVKQIAKLQPEVECDVVENGQQALERALQSGYSVILMDVDMPVLDGRSAVDRLRRQGYTRPICMLSGYADRSDIALSLRNGADEHLVKPLVMDALQAVLRRYL